MQDALLSMTDVCKRYGSVKVLEGVNFRIDRGESIALIGENGAGKSTFSKLVTGVATNDDGEIRFEGAPVRFNSPREALAKGIAFIPQELAYVPEMSVADNITLNQWASCLGFTSNARTLKAARDACRRYGIDLGDLSRRIGDLKLADRQIVEIVKALSRNAKLIILDEPTASLSEAESKALFEILGKLNREGVAIIYISHRMDEVFDFSHKVAVLRNGKLVAVRRPAETSHQELIADMLGQAAEQLNHRAASASPGEGDGDFRVLDWSLHGNPGLSNVSFSIGRGEIVGLYGLRGSGADSIAEGLGGLRPGIAGAIAINGRERALFANPLEARRAAVAYLPAERKRNGLVLSMPISSNTTSMILKANSRFGFLIFRRERRIAAKAVKDFGVKCRDIEQPVGELSGGNQQKILLASRMATEPELLVLHEPTRGVDVGARLQIHQFLVESADAGCAIAVITSDLEEAVTVCDRLLIVRGGAIVGELKGIDKTQAAAIALAAKQENSAS
jgi:ABC-type sugar transport system ATPase subunit